VLSYQESATVVLHLNIELPLATLPAILDAVAALPGVVVSEPVAIPRPRVSTQDDLDDRLRIDAGARRVFRDGLPVVLTRLEFDLLLYLSTRPNRVHGRHTILDQVWNVTEPYASRTVDVHIRRLRDKLGPFGDLINTVRGVGYRFDGAHRVVVDRTDGPV